METSIDRYHRERREKKRAAFEDLLNECKVCADANKVLHDMNQDPLLRKEFVKRFRLMYKERFDKYHGLIK